MDKHRNIYFLYLVLCSILATATGQFFWVSITVVMILAIIVTLAMSYVAMSGEEIVLEFDRLQHKDTEIAGRVKLNKRLPMTATRLTLEYENLLTGENVIQKYKCMKDMSVCFTSKHCGCIRIRIISVEALDAFDIIRVRVNKWSGRNCEVNVVPDTFKQHISIYAKEAEVEDGMSLSYLEGRTSQMLDVREYEKGDSLKQIHWKLSCKADELLVKRTAADSEFRPILAFDKGKAVKEYADMMAEVFVSMSQSLMDQGVSHTIMYQSEAGLIETDIDDQKDVIGVLLNVLKNTYTLEKRIKDERKIVYITYKENCGFISSDYDEINFGIHNYANKLRRVII